MYYNYEIFTVDKPKIKKWKVIVVVLIIITVISLAIYGGIQYAKYENEKKIQEELRKEQELIAEQKRIEEENEKKRMKNSQELTEKQIRSNRKYLFFRRKSGIFNF